MEVLMFYQQNVAQNIHRSNWNQEVKKDIPSISESLEP
jgi:hypothetical protein